MGRTKRYFSIAGLVVGLALIAAAVVYGLANASAANTMVGVVTARSHASIEATAQLGATGSVTIAKVVAPDESWVAVYLVDMDVMTGGSAAGAGMSGRLVGRTHVPAGESLGVAVDLDPGAKLTQDVLVVLQADRGVRGRFEFDAQRFEGSPDKPYYVGAEEISERIQVRFNDMANSI